MSEWRMIKLDDCLDLITYGFTNPMPDADNGPWKITAKDINDGRIDFSTARHTTINAYENELTDKSRPLKDDLLLTKDGTLGRLAIVGDEKVCINQSVALLRVKQEILNVRFLLYLLSTPEYQGKMMADAGGSTIKHIYITKVNQLLIPVPSIFVQNRIVSILSAYDDLIETNQRQIKLLEEAAQRLYKEWFVDLRFPGHENVPVVDGVPEGWTIQNLANMADINKESIGKEYSYESIKYVDISCVTQGQITDKTVYELKDAPGRARRLAHDGDVIWSMVRPNLRAYALIQYPEANDVFSTGFAILSPKTIPFSYLYCVVTTDDFVGYLVNCTNGAAYPAVKPIHFEEAKIVVPESSLLHKYESLSTPMFRKIHKIQHENDYLAEARDRLLPKLMSGEIIV